MSAIRQIIHPLKTKGAISVSPNSGVQIQIETPFLDINKVSIHLQNGTENHNTLFVSDITDTMVEIKTHNSSQADSIAYIEIIEYF